VSGPRWLRDHLGDAPEVVAIGIGALLATVVFVARLATTGATALPLLAVVAALWAGMLVAKRHG
jgi:hypothetical protein